jgi:hypothetical protein
MIWALGSCLYINTANNKRQRNTTLGTRAHNRAPEARQHPRPPAAREAEGAHCFWPRPPARQ